MMKILLFANIGSAPNSFYHVGDEAMFLETCRWYQTTHPSYTISIFTSQPNHGHLNINEIKNPLEFQFIGKKELFSIFIKTFLFKYLNKNFFDQKEYELVNSIKEQDRIHLCGGGNLNSIYPGWLYYSLVILVISLLYSKDTVLTSQTIGPFSFIDKLLAYLIINKARIVAVRGHADTLKNLGIVSPKIYNMLDAAYGLPVTTDKKQLKKKLFRIGLSLHDWKGSKKFFEALVGSLKDISKKVPIEIVLIPHVLVDDDTQWDMGFMSGLFNKLGTELNIIQPVMNDILTSKPEPAYYIKNITGTVDLLISTRYHGVIFALSQNIPVLTYTSDFYYSDKNTNALKLYYPNNFDKYSMSSSDKHLNSTLTSTLRLIIKNNIQEKLQLKKINSKLLLKYDLFKNNLGHKILD